MQTLKNIQNMKSRITLAIVGCTLLTLLSPCLVTAQSRNIGTNRQPRACGSRMAPTSGAIDAEQAAIYAACDRETGGYQNNFSTQFMDILNVQVSKPRQVRGNDSRIFNNIDTTKPAYDLQGSVVHYMCHTIGGGHPAGGNCTVSRVPESVGVCVQDTFSKWSCNMSYYTPKPEYQMPPPQ